MGRLGRRTENAKVAVMLRRERSILVASLLAALLLPGLSIAAAPALALPSEFGSEGEGAGQFSAPRGIAVDQQSGDVFVADQKNQRVDRFGSHRKFKLAWGWGVADGATEAFQRCEVKCFAGSGAGEFMNPRGIAVDNSGTPGLQGDVYVLDQSRVQRFDPGGKLLWTFAEGGTSVAVGATGNVYVGAAGRVRRFSAEGVAEGETALPLTGAVQRLAVDSAGELYVMAEGLSGVHKYSAGGLELGSPRDATAAPRESAMTLGPAGELFIYDQRLGHVFVFNANGTQTGSFAVGREAGGVSGIAYGTTVHGLYLLRGEKPRGGVLSCFSSSGAPSRSCTKKQNLAKALAGCQRLYAYARKRRARCERRARRRYQAKAPRQRGG